MTQISSYRFWISDWAQEVIPSKFREGPRDCYAKKRMSLHAVFILKTNNNEIRTCRYFTALDNCDQDVVDTLCITDHVLCEMKKDFPDLSNVIPKIR